MTGKNEPRHEFTGRRIQAGANAIGDFTYSVIESAPMPRRAGERRGEARVRSWLREGSVAERRGRSLVECRIRDLSKRGARLQLDKDRPLPKSFLLTEAGTLRCFWAMLVWQVGRDAGVKLTPIEP